MLAYKTDRFFSDMTRKRRSFYAPHSPKFQVWQELVSDPDEDVVDALEDDFEDFGELLFLLIHLLTYVLINVHLLMEVVVKI